MQGFASLLLFHVFIGFGWQEPWYPNTLRVRPSTSKLSIPSKPSAQSKPIAKADHNKQNVRTPLKDGAEEEFETPPKERPLGFSGKVNKVAGCKVCGAERDADFVGGSCQYCLKVCRQLFKHQRMSEVLGCEERVEEVKKKSQEMRPTEKSSACRNKCACSQDVQKLFDLMHRFANIAEVLPRLERVAAQLEQAQHGNPKKRKASE